MRIGQNPAKFIKSVVQPQRITVAVVTYIPFLSGYYAQSLDVLKVCLNSIWENTVLPYDLMVFDNGSCPEVRNYLSEARDRSRIQYLVLSEKNIGKGGAWNFIFGAAPGEYIAYADSDVYFYPGWLAPQIGILEIFPDTGMVTGMPMWTPSEFSTATVQWAEANPDVQLERGKFLAWEDYWRHARSLGADEVKARAHFDASDDIVVIRDGKRYFVGAAHFQFVARKSALQSVIPIPSQRPMGQVRLLDIALNEHGYLRFSTPEWWVRHIGNTPGTEFTASGTEPAIKSARCGSRGIWGIKPIRGLVNWLYRRTFEILYRG